MKSGRLPYQVRVKQRVSTKHRMGIGTCPAVVRAGGAGGRTRKAASILGGVVFSVGEMRKDRS